jgi:hypothetical protein
MNIAVISPYYRETLPILSACHQSVRAQSVPCTHVMVADGFPSAEVQSWPVEHLILPRSHNDFGSTPRAIGSFHAVGLGFDGVAFLDADNWYRADHLQKLLDLHARTGAPFVTSSRVLCRIDGSVLTDSKAFENHNFADTSCMLIMRPAFGVLANWVLMPQYAQPISDRVFLHLARASGTRIVHSQEPTVYYRCVKSDIYELLRETPPPGARPPPDYETAFRRWEADGHAPLI